MASGKTIKQIKEEKSKRTMDIVAWMTGYYRENPQRFVTEILQINLKLFQKILLWAMMHYHYFMYLAARGQGKTFLTALFCCVRAILFPGTKIVVCSGTIKQANEVLSKIQDELMPMSAILRTEIKKCSVGQNDSSIYFMNGSWIKTRTSTQNARSARANLIIVDEFRMVDKIVLDTVIRKFLAGTRHPKYLDNPKYAHLMERNREIYMSSCWLKDHWSWKKACAYTQNFFIDTKKYFICGLPVELSLLEGLIMRSQVEDELSESDFSQFAWNMEMECLWFGDGEGSFFRFDDFNKMRRIDECLYPLKFYNETLTVPDPPVLGERLLSVDVALMASTKKKKNDAAALYINDLEKVGETRYKSNIVFGDTKEGLTTDELGLLVMRYFYKYKCTRLVLDCSGSGLGVYDYIIRNQYDPETGEEYKAMTCANNEDMADRCKIIDANKVVYSVKATADFNSQICISLRDGIKNGRINFLKNELIIDEWLAKNFKGYKKLSLTEQSELKLAYVQTTMAAYELIRLQTKSIAGNKIKVYEQSGMRKDRYSSLAYNFWLACLCEQELRPNYTDANDLVNRLAKSMRRSSILGKPKMA